MELGQQLIFLFVIALAVAVIAWTVTHEEIFKEPRDYCAEKSKNCKSLFQRKFFYVWTCEYCFSFYVTALMLYITRFHLLYTDWKGYLIAGFALIALANVYMSLFFHLRIGIKKEGVEVKIEEKELEEKEFFG